MLRYLLALAILAAQLSACAGQSANKAAIDEIERHHEEELTRMGGGGGGGSSGSM
jgi:hypothetical protein